MTIGLPPSERTPQSTSRASACVADRLLLDRGKLRPMRPLSPNEKQADIAGHPVGKVHNPRGKMETLRLQIMAPS
jgi:hypothetical protein